MLNRQERRKVEQVARTNGHTDTWGWTNLTLSTGRVIRVRSLPPYLADAAMADFPAPKPPIINIPSQVPGGGTTYRENHDDLEFIQKQQEWMDRQREVVGDLQFAWGVDVEVPEGDFYSEIEEYIPNLHHTSGKNGRKIDYIKYVLLTNNADFLAVRRATAGMNITMEEVKAVEDSFRG